MLSGSGTRSRFIPQTLRRGMHRSRRWNIAAASPAAEELAGQLKTSPLIAQILLNRGLSAAEPCQQFLRPSLKSLHDPASLANATKAASRIAQAIREKQKIVIYGDYDVDGISATAILWHAITLLGGQVDFYIPHRIDEGYGLNAEAIVRICDQGAQLIISVDCGITALEPARAACDRGVDLIITDHHQWHEADDKVKDAEVTLSPGHLVTGSLPSLPPCFTIVHPRLPSEAGLYANPYLCGAGVAFKLAWAVGMAMNGATKVNDDFRKFLVDATALAALATIADVVPLVGENRILAAFGLSGLKQSKLTGLKALIASAGLTDQKLDSYDVGFRLAPRLNACGRMGHAQLAVEMLTRADEAKAMEIAIYLEQQNRQRQSMEKKILEEALKQIAELKLAEEGQCAIVLGGEGWHAGVIGIVASRIVDRFHRPTVMVALTDGAGQGSARSIAGFHLAKALEACAEHLQGHGGHEMAAGLKLAPGKFEAFRKAFCEHVARVIPPALLVPEVNVDAVAELRQITPALVKDFQRLGPFGQGNPRPLLCCQGIEVATPPRRVGRTGDHLQLQVRQGGTTIKCIAFGQGDLEDRLSPGTKIDLAFEPTLNEYNGYVNVQLEVKDIRFGADR